MNRANETHCETNTKKQGKKRTAMQVYWRTGNVAIIWVSASMQMALWGISRSPKSRHTATDMGFASWKEISSRRMVCGETGRYRERQRAGNDWEERPDQERKIIKGRKILHFINRPKMSAIWISVNQSRPGERWRRKVRGGKKVGERIKKTFWLQKTLRKLDNKSEKHKCLLFSREQGSKESRHKFWKGFARFKHEKRNNQSLLC